MPKPVLDQGRAHYPGYQGSTQGRASVTRDTVERTGPHCSGHGPLQLACTVRPR